MTFDSRHKLRARKLAEAMLAGTVPLLEGVQQMLTLVYLAPELFSKTDHNLFVGIESEIDTLPIGPVRQHWHPSFLEEKDQEIARYSQAVSTEVLAACHRLLANINTSTAP